MVMSHNLLEQKVFPYLQHKEPIFFILIDNLRLDQWKLISPYINKYLKQEEEDLFCSILPTTTQYSRNAIFSGLMPSDIEKKFPDKWFNDDDDGGKNRFESDFLEGLLKRKLSKHIKWSYHKVFNMDFSKHVN